MTLISDANRAEFFSEVDTVCRKAVWCAIATVAGNEPRVRLVHPTWEGETLWFATGTDSPKARQMRANTNVDIQYQTSPPEFIHVLVRGTAEVLTDEATRRHIWGVMDYDLAQFWPEGPTAPAFAAVRIRPSRVELSYMFGSQNKRVWKRR